MKQEQGKYASGYAAGYARGMEEGIRSFGSGLEGTSIIIPTYNRRDLLLQCLDSIEAHTHLPYEIIIVDNGSEDGTAEAIRRRQRPIRLAVHEQNLGFARAINTGLMMAKGQYIVLLNNDVLVTERWLDQLLYCLSQRPDAAAVGPVTNYISGDQQIAVPYGDDIAAMQVYAAAHNVTDPAKWRETERLVGFCLVFPRSTFEQIGYLDEGYAIGNYEDDDWVARLRLQGKKQVVAADTFIHHYGSMTMKGLGEQGFAEVNTRNHDFFAEKWGDLQSLYLRMPGLRSSGALRSADFFPSGVCVKGWNATVYWLEHGVRYPLEGNVAEGVGSPPTRLAVTDLLHLPRGAGRSMHEVLALRAGLAAQPGQEGSVTRAADGRLYQLDRGQRREVVSEYACRAWGLTVSGEIPGMQWLEQYPEGLPILPPLRLLNEDL